MANTPKSDISDNYEVVETPSGSNSNSPSSSDLRHPSAGLASDSRADSRGTPTVGVTPPPHAVRRGASRDDWYPSWLPRRPPPPAPASTVASERGQGNSPVPFAPTPSNGGTTRDVRPVARGTHKVTPSYGTNFTGYTEATSADYVDIGDYEEGGAQFEDDGFEGNVGIGRRQTPRSVRIVSENTAGVSNRQASSRHSRKVSNIRSRKEGPRASGHAHGSAQRWRATMSTPLSPTVFSPSPFPGLDQNNGANGASAVPRHMRMYLPNQGMHNPHGSSGFLLGEMVNTRPRFRAPNVNLGILQSPSAWMRLWYFIWPFWIYGLVVLQSFLDLNSVFCLVQLAIHPTPLQPPSSSIVTTDSSSRRNWTLAAASYGLCWFFWIAGVVILYEVVYCWWRLWRSKRPLIMPLYLSAPAFNLVCMTSYVNFCFFRFVRASARPALPRFLRVCGSSSSASSTVGRAPSALSGPSEARASQQREREVSSPTTAEDKENVPVISQRSISNPTSLTALASWKDWLAESFYFYGQNLPTVALLIPRAALCLAALLAYSTAPPEDVALASLGLMNRDSTFFRPDGSLSGYARGILWTNVAWAAWRAGVLLISWTGLWFLSGQLCAGVCGPRFRWEEPEEKPGYGAVYDDEELEAFQAVMASWKWRECTKERLIDAYDLCQLPPTSARIISNEEKQAQRVGGAMNEDEEDAVLDRVLAAAGLPTVPTPARRGVLRGELFNTPPEARKDLPQENATEERPISRPESAVVASVKRNSREQSPSNMSPYPFTTYPAKVSSEDPIPRPQSASTQDKIPFPPSPRQSEHDNREEADELEGEEDEEDFEDEECDEFGLGVEEPSSSGRASGSMSSLGHQIPSRFPFQFRHVSRRSRGGRSSVGTSHTQQSKSTSNQTSSASYYGMARTLSSPDRRRESQGSSSPWSPSGSVAQSPSAWTGNRSSDASAGAERLSPIPMPPGRAHRPRQQRASLPTLPVSALPTAFADIVYNRARSQSASTAQSTGPRPHPPYSTSGDDDDEIEQSLSRTEEGMLTDPEPEGSQEELEREDSVGLLSGGPSPRSSLGGLRNRSNVSLTNLSVPYPRRRGRHSSASSQSNSNSRSSGSRAESFSGSHSGASRSASQVRSRAQSLIQSIGAAGRSNVSIEQSQRSRTNSLARVSEHRQSEDSGVGTSSGASHGVSARAENVGDDTFGQPIQLRVESPATSDKSNGSGSNGKPISASPPESENTESSFSSSGEEAGPALSPSAPLFFEPPARSEPISTSTGGEQQHTPLSPPQPPHGGQSFISSANESFITRPTEEEASSGTAGQTPSSYGTVPYPRDQDPSRRGSGWQPA